MDYILATKGLVQWIKYGDIQPSVKGSDHCPIFIDLHDEIILPSGETLSLRDAMRQGSEHQDPPRLSAKYWEEFSGKQTLLSSFFNRGNQKSECNSQVSQGPNSGSSSQTSHSPQPPSQRSTPLRPKPSTSRITPKRKTHDTSSPAPKKMTRQGSGQSSISAFFVKPLDMAAGPSPPLSETKQVIELDNKVMSHFERSSSSPTPTSSQLQADAEVVSQLDADHRLAMELASAEDAPPSPQSQPASSSQSKAAWSNLFTPIQPPNCIVHGEPAKKFTVNKPGPNKGRTFFVCSRLAWHLLSPAR